MYNKRTIIPGLIIFVLILTAPIWYNRLNAGAMPKVELPKGYKQCVLPLQEIRDKHMQLLLRWRDEVIRKDERQPITVDGQVFGKGLQLACLKCHPSQQNFCEKCHTYADVKPYCWECHFFPSQAASMKETH
jgi:hypothetical protein